jgi:hypothetical protein
MLFTRLMTLFLTPPDSVWNHPRFYVRYAFPLALSALGFLAGCLFPRKEVA